VVTFRVASHWCELDPSTVTLKGLVTPSARTVVVVASKITEAGGEAGLVRDTCRVRYRGVALQP